MSGEFLLKLFLVERQLLQPHGIICIKAEYQIPQTHRRVDVLGQDEHGMVVIEIKASTSANMDAIHQILDYRRLVAEHFNKPTRAILMAYSFTPQCFKQDCSQLRLMGLEEHFATKGGISYEFTRPRVIRHTVEALNMSDWYSTTQLFPIGARISYQIRLPEGLIQAHAPIKR